MFKTLLLDSMLLMSALGDPVKFDLTRSMPNYQKYNGSDSPNLDQIHQHFYKLLEGERNQIKLKFDSLTHNQVGNDHPYVDTGIGKKVEMVNILNSQYLAKMYFGNPS